MPLSSAPQRGLKDNPGRSGNLFDQSHPYFPADCSACPFNSGFKNRLTSVFHNRKKDCANCSKINKVLPSTNEIDGYRAINTQQGSLRIHSEHGKAEAEENISVATYLVNKYGYEIDLIPNPDNKVSPDSFNRTLGFTQEYKVNSTPTKSSIDNLLRDGARQASHLVLRIDSNIDLDTLARGIRGRVNQTKNIEEVTLILNGKDLTLSRGKILSKGFKMQQEDFA